MTITLPKAFNVHPSMASFQEKPDIGSHPHIPSPLAVAPLRVDRSTDAFFTPDKIAEEIVDMVTVFDGMQILEPSAGVGNLIAPFSDDNVRITAIESHYEIFQRLRTRFDHINLYAIHGDFLAMNDLNRFHLIVMNPPFARNAASKHIEHALKFLLPEGELIAIVPNTYQGPGETVRELPSGTFNSTQVSTKIIHHTAA